MITITISGPPGSGKTTLAEEMKNWFFRRGRPVLLFDGDDDPPPNEKSLREGAKRLGINTVIRTRQTKK